MADNLYVKEEGVPTIKTGREASLTSLKDKTACRAGFSLTEVLAALVLALIPFGPLMQASVVGKTLSFTASQAFVSLLILHLLISSLARKTPRVADARWPVGRMVMIAAIMLPPALLAPDLAAAGQAYVNFALGTVGGIIVGYIWCLAPAENVGAIDIGLAVFLVWATIQLAFAFSTASESMTFHQAAVTPWGGSNYVAGTMVVGAFALVGRLIRVSGVSFIRFGPAIAAIIVAVMTLSRGAILATAVGLGAFLWTVGVTSAKKLLLRITALLVPFGAWVALHLATENRLAINSQATRNVEIRFEQYALAWADFGESPFTGKGWVSFRETAFEALGNQTSFVHNVFLSFLQMGGIVFGLPILVFLIMSVLRACNADPLLAAATLAAVTIAMSDPFFESTAASIVAWAVIGKAIQNRSSPAGILVANVQVEGVPTLPGRTLKRP